MKISKGALTSILVLFIVGGLSVIKFDRERQWHSVSDEARVSARVKGNTSARVRIIEYTDFQCPACASANGLVENMLKLYPGKISLEHKHFPLAMHAHSRRASVFAECASGQGKFWPFEEALFKSQESWTKMGQVDAYFSELAVSLGIEGTRLLACVNSPEADARVKKDMDDGRGLQVKSTPTFFVNGTMVVGGPLLVKEVEKILGSK